MPWFLIICGILIILFIIGGIYFSNEIKNLKSPPSVTNPKKPSRILSRGIRCIVALLIITIVWWQKDTIVNWFKSKPHRWSVTDMVKGVEVPDGMRTPVGAETFTTNITVTVSKKVVSSKTNGAWRWSQVAITNVAITSNRPDDGLKWELFWEKPPDVSGGNSKLRTFNSEVRILENNTRRFVFIQYYKWEGKTEEAHFFWDKTKTYGDWSQNNPPDKGKWWLKPDPGSKDRYHGGQSDSRSTKFIPMWLVRRER
jgi:hypothetical protein